MTAVQYNMMSKEIESNGYQTRPHNAGIVKAVPLAVLIAMSPMTTANAEARPERIQPQKIEYVEIPSDKIGDVIYTQEFKEGSRYYGNAVLKVVSTKGDDSEGDIYISFKDYYHRDATPLLEELTFKAEANIKPEKLIRDKIGYWIEGTGEKSYSIKEEGHEDSWTDPSSAEKTSGKITIQVSKELFYFLLKLNEFPHELNLDKSIGKEFKDLTDWYD